MLSINMRVFKTVLLVAALFSSRVECLPLANETSLEETSTTYEPGLSTSVDHYDQRQNGTENYRLHVDGVVFVFAPAEALLLASATGANIPNLPIPDSSKPTTGNPETETKPLPAPKSTKRTSVNLANLLVPFLRRLRQK